MVSAPKNGATPEIPPVGGQEVQRSSADPVGEATAHGSDLQLQLPNLGFFSSAPTQPIFPPATPQLIIQQTERWQSPFPAPEHVKQYEAVLPGTFDRIVRMTEQAQAAQLESERYALERLCADSRRGNYLGVAITVSAMLCSMICVFHNAMWIAGLFLSVPVMSVSKVLIESARLRFHSAAIASNVAEKPRPVHGSPPP